MQINRTSEAMLPLQLQTQWMWYSSQLSSFIVGDERSAFTVPTSGSSQPTPLPPHTSVTPACNLPINDSLFSEFAGISWHGFKLLDRPTAAPDGDLLRTIVFGPNYGQCVEHPATGLVMSLKSGSIQLRKHRSAGFQLLDQTKTRGKAALAFAAHPSEPLIVYGDNYGVFHSHDIEGDGFGKASKLADKQRNASRVEFINGGTALLVGGTGYLSSYAYAAGKFTALHDLGTSVRDFLWLEEKGLIFVNQGVHGVSTFRYESTGFTKLAEVRPDAPVHGVALSADGRYLAMTNQNAAGITVYATG